MRSISASSMHISQGSAGAAVSARRRCDRRSVALEGVERNRAGGRRRCSQRRHAWRHGIGFSVIHVRRCACSAACCRLDLPLTLSDTIVARAWRKRGQSRPPRDCWLRRQLGERRMLVLGSSPGVYISSLHLTSVLCYPPSASDTSSPGLPTGDGTSISSVCIGVGGASPDRAANSPRRRCALGLSGMLSARACEVAPRFVSPRKGTHDEPWEVSGDAPPSSGSPAPPRGRTRTARTPPGCPAFPPSAALSRPRR